MELSMEQLSEILRAELEEAVQVKNPNALKRFTLLLSENIITQREYERDQGGLRGDIRLLTESMDRGFKEMERRFEEVNKRFEDFNKRFDDVNKRFDDSNHRFNTLVAFLSVGLAAIMAILAYGTFFAG